jgi:hypothetical protein
MSSDETAFRQALETADWLRAHGFPTSGDDLERKARAIHDEPVDLGDPRYGR